MTEQNEANQKVYTEQTNKFENYEKRILDIEFVLFKMNENGKSQLFGEIYNRIDQVSEKHRNEEERLSGIINLS